MIKKYKYCLIKKYVPEKKSLGPVTLEIIYFYYKILLLSVANQIKRVKI